MEKIYDVCWLHSFLCPGIPSGWKPCVQVITITITSIRGKTSHRLRSTNNGASIAKELRKLAKKFDVIAFVTEKIGMPRETNDDNFQ
eukprot:331305-Rhodomonas_salina.1